MNKLIALALAVLLTLTLLAGCGANGRYIQSDSDISVVATIFPPYDFVREIAGDKASVAMLLPPGAESHSFEPTTQDIIKIEKCNVFIYTGGESDRWVDQILGSMDTSKMTIISMLECVDAVEEQLIEGMQPEEQEDAQSSDKPEFDEHVWTSPLNAKRIVQAISGALCKVDQGNTAFYQGRTADYLNKLDELDATFRDIADHAVRKTLVFGDRFPFRYFADAYGLKCAAAFPGCSTETEASANTIKTLIDKVNAEHIPVVFHIELSNSNIADVIAESTGAKVRTLHAVHNISKTDLDKGEGYISLMTRNVDALKEALQ